MDTRRERALDLLLCGRTPSEVGAEVGVRRETVWRWSQEPDFTAELERRRALAGPAPRRRGAARPVRLPARAGGRGPGRRGPPRAGAAADLPGHDGRAA